MTRRIHQLFILPVLLSLIVFNLQCDRSHRTPSELSENGLVRLMDILNQSNVKASPFAGILDHFNVVEEDFSGKLKPFNELSTSKQKVLAVTTDNSILGYDETKKPQEMEVWINDDLVNFFDEPEDNEVNWSWIDTDREIDISNADNYNRQLKCIVMDIDEPFSFETILPEAPVELEIKAKRNWHPVDLEIYINGEIFKKKPVGKRIKIFRIQRKAKFGLFEITVKPGLSKKIVEKDRPTPPRLLLYSIKVKTKNDIVLFSLPSTEQNELLSSKIKSKYTAEQLETGEENEFLELYKMKHSFTSGEFDQEENPENVKKKLSYRDLSIDALMAPATSRFDFPFNLPPDCVLEFGIGLINKKKDNFNEPVKFSVFAEEKGTSKVIFQKELSAGNGEVRNQITQEKIKLHPFSGKDIKLSFVTELSGASAASNHVFPFWYNPIIFRPISEKPNIILISLDTLRADHLSCYGYNRNTSPNMDEFAEECVMFQNVYVHSPWTLPSHVSMLYSLNSANHQVYYSTEKIDPSLPSMASFLRKHGYVTCGLTGGGFVSSIFGFAKGFDWYENPISKTVPDEAERLFGYASSWLEENRDKPFFLFLHTFQIHGPYHSPSPWNKSFLGSNAKWEKIGLKNFLDSVGNDYEFSQEEIDNIVDLYDGEIKYTDEKLIKPLISYLKDLEIYDNTLIIITSDHGEEFYEHEGWLHSNTLYEELLRVPLLIKFPNSEFKGTRIKTRCRSIDIMPTILELAAVKYDKKSIDGKSLSPLISGKESEDRTFISDVAFKNVPAPCPVLVATNRENMKFIFEKSKSGLKSIQVYDLENDMSEKRNIFQKFTMSVEKVRAAIDEYYEKQLKKKRKIDQIQLDEKMKEKLRALGYLK